MADFQVGEVIEYDDGGDFRLAVIREVGKSLLVVTEAGAETRVATRAVTRATGLKQAAQGDKAAVGQRLASLRAEIEGMEQEAPLPEVWELLLAEGQSVGLPELAGWLYGDNEARHLLGAWWQVRRHPVYFKERQGVYEPRPESQVEMLLRQQAAEEAARQAEARFVGTFTAVAAVEALEARQAALTEALVDPELRARFELMEAYALEGDTFEKASQAGALVDLLVDAGVRVGGKGADRAFALMVALGRHDEHANLTLVRLGIETTMDPAFVESARALLGTIPWLETTGLDGVDPGGREDLTALPIATVDDASTRDIDDGISLVALDGGGWEVGIHIADPAEVVPIDHELEAEARRKGTSVYVPGATIPMFPRVLSEDAMSLVAGRLRPAMSFFVTFDDQLSPVTRRVALSWVVVAHRLTYEEVDAIIAGENPEHPMAEALGRLHAIAEALLARRLERGAAVLLIPEARVKVVRGEGGELEALEVGEMADTPSRALIQEMMVLAGESAGMICQEAGLPVLYRSQPSPEDPEALAALAGKAHPLVDAFRLRRNMRRGEMGDVALPHFGLGLEAYVQATSPIRRYADLMCHRQLRAWLRGEPLPYSAEQVGGISQQLGQRMGDASLVERDGKRYWTLVHLQGRRGEVLDATVLTFADERRRRMWIWLDGLGLATQMPVAGQVEEGQAIRVKVDSVHPRRDLLSLRVVEAADGSA